MAAWLVVAVVVPTLMIPRANITIIMLHIIIIYNITNSNSNNSHVVHLIGMQHQQI